MNKKAPETYSASITRLRALVDRLESAQVDVDELESLMETAHLLRSPKNAERLYSAFKRTENQALQISSLKELRREMELENKELEAVGNSGSESSDKDIVREVE